MATKKATIVTTEMRRCIGSKSSASRRTSQATKTIAGFRITNDTLVLATIQGNVAGTWVRGVSLNVAKRNFVIRLNKAAPEALQVGWFIVN